MKPEAKKNEGMNETFNERYTVPPNLRFYTEIGWRRTTLLVEVGSSPTKKPQHS